MRANSSNIVVSTHFFHNVRIVAAAGSESALRPVLVSCNRVPESWASPPAWISSGQAKARIGPAFSS
jgi:hypothetical protein